MVSFAEVEQLKQELTDKFVVVDKNAPELRRFVGLTGLVKTVNMSGRALVQFDGPVDIAWYDIDPSFLTVVDKPLPKKVEAKAEPAVKPAAAKPAAAGGKSPLELAREQAAKAAGGVAKPAGGKSPLELAREQAAKAQAAKAQAAAPAPETASTPETAPAAQTPAPAAAPPKTDASGKPLSPLELARMQGAFKGKK